MTLLTSRVKPEEVRHASRNAESACPFLYWRDGKKGHTESAFRDACRTSSGVKPPLKNASGVGVVSRAHLSQEGLILYNVTVCSDPTTFVGSKHLWFVYRVFAYDVTA